MSAREALVPFAHRPATCGYRGRIAPTPTGYLHLGHARTFALARDRAEAAGGTLVFRVEDVDSARCEPRFATAALEDLAALGIRWDEGPDVGGPCAPYEQSRRIGLFLDAWRRLRDAGVIYPCRRSRRDVTAAAGAPHAEDESDPVFPSGWRPKPGFGADFGEPGDWNWRFRVPDGECVAVSDALSGECEYVAGRDFGDFVVWRRDGVPAYELAVVVDDIAMGITEVVRGRDLLKSAARQTLLYRELGAAPPAWAHAPLVLDAEGRRLAKRSGATGVRELLRKGFSAADILSAPVERLTCR